MIKQIIAEDDVEIFSIKLFKDLNYQYKRGSDFVSEDTKGGERDSLEKAEQEQRMNKR